MVLVMFVKFAATPRGVSLSNEIDLWTEFLADSRYQSFFSYETKEICVNQQQKGLAVYGVPLSTALPLDFWAESREELADAAVYAYAAFRRTGNLAFEQIARRILLIMRDYPSGS